MKLIKNVFALATACALSTPALAQDGAVLDEGRTSYRIIYADVADGKGEEFDAAVNKLNDIGVSIGQMPITYMHMMSGKWSVMILIPLEDGMASLDYRVSPSGAAFMAAATEAFGSKEAYEAADKELNAMIEDSMVEYGHTHAPE